MKFNRNDLVENKKFYLYMKNFLLDFSGNGELHITDNIQDAIDFTDANEIYEIQLKKIELESIEKCRPILIKQIKNS